MDQPRIGAVRGPLRSLIPLPLLPQSSVSTTPRGRQEPASAGRLSRVLRHRGSCTTK
jgi:hypothetical protein